VCRVCPTIFDCFRCKRFDLGLSCVEAEDPEKSDGVDVGSGTSGREVLRACGPVGDEIALVYLICDGIADCSSSRRSSFPARCRTSPAGGDLDSMAGMSNGRLVDGRFLTSLDGREGPAGAMDDEIAVRVGNRLDVFCIISIDGDTTRLELPVCCLWGAMTAAGLVRPRGALYVRLTYHKLVWIDKS
jgi:hypothetical protein